MGKKSGVLRSFPPQFWLVIMFEFFERGSYYGVMSILSVYLTDILHFPKESVGLIKGTIQPLLYFLPIISGALADRFGYRRTLLVAFTLLGGGYLLTSQVTSYTAVFLALCVMGLGAGAFKPIVSGTIARVTDESNSTLGFGVYYWSINLGAFLFPLILVPLLKNSVGWSWVLVAAAVGTGIMILPTLFLFREPERPAEAEGAAKANLIQSLANAFEIVYSPVVLVLGACRRRRGLAVVVGVIAAAFVVLAGWRYAAPHREVVAAPGVAYQIGGTTLVVRVERNMTREQPFSVAVRDGEPAGATLVVHRPDEAQRLAPEMLEALAAVGLPHPVAPGRLVEMVADAVQPPRLELVAGAGQPPFEIEKNTSDEVTIRAPDPSAYPSYRASLISAVRAEPGLAALPGGTLDELFDRGTKRPFLLAFVALLLVTAAVVLSLKPRWTRAEAGGRTAMAFATAAVLAGSLWLLPGLSVFARVVSTVIAMTVLSLYLIDVGDRERMRANWRFLLLIFLYSGFWILYFQMFDSVLWYVQAYVDASSLDRVVNGVLGSLGIAAAWHFDIEHVTVINAGTIILLQLVVSSIVRSTRALPTMIVGIGLGTIGMAILAISTQIWVFMAGIVIFSIGEMTAHPKLISYIGQIAPRDRVGTYMGYIFLYGVIGSSIGAVLGANLYVRFVDQLNQPRTLWLIFSLIGVATIVALAVYDRLVSSHR
jgi:dipeptide/tripeptide permease